MLVTFVSSKSSRVINRDVMCNCRNVICVKTPGSAGLVYQ